jgi:DNA polymerase-3 subunit delta
MKSPEIKTNVYLFYGEDDFSLRRKVEQWKTEFAKKYSAAAVVFLDAADLSEAELIKKLETELTPSLFSSKKLLIVRDGLPKKSDQERLAAFLLKLAATLSPDDFVVFWQTTKPDGRQKFVKEFKAAVHVQEFILPHGRELNAWIMAMAKKLGASITPPAAEALATALGRDLFEEKKAGGRVVERHEAFDLWQANSELAKLAAFAPEITPEAVSLLVPAKVPDSVFIFSDSLAAKDRRQAYAALANFLAGAAGDEKGAFIKIIGLLAEQFRSLLLLNTLQTAGLSAADIAEKLGWSSGRVFMMSKRASSFAPDVLRRILARLLAIDLAIKSTDANPRLMLDQFIAELI